MDARAQMGEWGARADRKREAWDKLTQGVENRRSLCDMAKTMCGNEN
jgi:hypothetical protein